jgi:predicted  nucleic acid-binding Zn-ribbon protein
MSEATQSLLVRLIELSKTDAAAARLLAERKRLEDGLRVKEQELSAQRKKASDLQKSLNERRAIVRKEENEVKFEQEKLVNRRKALATLGNHKLQQAAEREIDGVKKQLELREEELLKAFMIVEEGDKELETLELRVLEFEDALTKLRNQTIPALGDIDKARAEKEAERGDLAKAIEPASLRKYDQIVHRFPTDALVQLTKNACQGCFMSISPQLFQKIAKGDALVQCPGCNRILYLAENPA